MRAAIVYDVVLAQQVTVAMLCVLVVVATVMPALRGDAWWIRVFDFPRVQSLGVAVVAAVAVFFVFKNWPAARAVGMAVMAACAVAQGFKILPYTRVHPVQVEAVAVASRDDARSLRLMVANVFMENRDFGALVEAVRGRAPDVVTVIEADDWWQSQLQPLTESHPHTVLVPQEDTYGMLVYSRFPLHDVEVQYLFEPDVPSVHARVELPSGEELDLHILHPKPPAPTESKDTKERDAEILTVGKHVAKRERPAIVAGDLNDVAWSATTELFKKVSRLLDPRIGRGMFNSFHAEHWYLRFPLDHVFHSEDFQLVSIERLPYIGSDHFPILVDLVLRPTSAHEVPVASDEEKVRADDMIDKPADASGQ